VSEFVFAAEELPTRLLLVEDNPADHRLVREILSECAHSRFETSHAPSLEAALDLLRSGDFQVMLLDLMLPDASGLDTLIRAHAAAPNLPIIVMTGLDDESLALEAMVAGAQDYLVKGSFDPPLLERSIRYAIGRGQMLLALKESEERYALAVQGANDGIWDWSLASGTIYYSPRWRAMLGCTEDELASSPDEWFGRIHPDDVEQVRALLADHIEGRTPCFEAEYRIRHRDGSLRWALSRGLAVRNSPGEACRIAGSQTDITARKEVEQRLLYSAFHDELTGLANHTLLLDRLEQAILRHRRRKGSLLGVLSLELDRFRMITDSFGPAVGDQLVKAVAERLQTCVRAEDTVARIGRDHFAVLLEDLHDLRQSVEVAERIQREIVRPFSLQGHDLFTPASIGITTSTEQHEQPDEYLRDAGIAMNLAQSAGGGRYQVFGSDMHLHVLSRFQLEGELRRGLEHGEFCMYYQPIVVLRTGAIAGFEALLRWRHPERGVLAPSDFLQVVEETGLIAPVFRSLLPDILRQLKRWQEVMPAEPPLFVNVNLSKAQLLDPGLAEQIGRVLAEIPMRSFSLGLELTESMIMENIGAKASMLLDLKAQKIQLHLDDFGTGYSSLSCLHRLPIDTLKIDKSFVSSLGIDSESIEIIRTIVSLARALGLKTIAEGIETSAQLEAVRLLKCEFGQGYLFARPVDSVQASRLLSSGRLALAAKAAEEGPQESLGRVLVVDDDPLTLNLLRLQLEEQRFEVMTVSSGPACLEKALSWAPEVILLDIMMPGMDGLETCRRLKQSAETGHIPVLFVTGHGDDEATAVEALAAGGNDFLSKDASLPILLARVQCQVAICRAQARLRQMAMTDELTGVFSRRYLFNALRQAVKSTSRKRSSGLSCLLVDVDHFKRINDRLGHITGDSVLKKIASTIAEAARETDHVARFGGEEFVVVLPNTDLAGATTVAERIRSAIERECPSITVSIGVAGLDSVDPADLLKPQCVDDLVRTIIGHADAAMYMAKERGRNRVVLFEE